MTTDSGSWLKDRRGNPSPWIALGLAVLFALAAIAAALRGEGAHVTAVLASLFAIAFSTAFGRQPVIAQIALAFGRRPQPGGSQSDRYQASDKTRRAA